MLSAASTSSAWAFNDSDKEAIRSLSNAAAADFERGQFESARDKFMRANAIAQVPRLAVWIARSNERMGQLVAAYEYYRLAVRLEPNELWIGDIQVQAQQEAEQALEAILPRLGKLNIQVEGADASDVAVTIDGVAIPSALLGVDRFVNPGTREVVAVRGRDKAQETVTLAEGAAKTVLLKFAARPRTRSELPTSAVSGRQSVQAVTYVPMDHAERSSQPLWGWASLGVGAAGILGGAAAAYVTREKYHGLRDACGGSVCPGTQQHRVEVYRRWRIGTTTAFILGGIATELGVVLLLTSPKSRSARQSTTAIGLLVSPELAGLEGSF